MNYKNLLILSAIATTTLSSADLIQNGSFEKTPHALTQSANGGKWDYFVGSISGWYSDTTYKGEKKSDLAFIEVGQAQVYGVTGQSGKNVLELDSNKNSKVSQNIDDIKKSDYYTVTFAAAQRAGTSVATNAFEVLWDDKVIATIDPASTKLKDYSFTFKGGKEEGKLSFLATGQSDSYGGIIDNVRMKDRGCNAPVPEPASMLALGGGLLGLLRRRRANA